MRVAATQINIVFGDVRGNLEKALALIHEAASQNASVVVLPEFFTSGIAIHPIMDDIARRNHECRVIEILREHAKKHNILICGSLLTAHGTDTYNTIFILEPGGGIFRHNKDLPTQFEHAYYTYGDTHRSYKRFGLAFCWEMLRSKTLREFGPQVQLVLAGSCWWGLPGTSTNEELRRYNQELNRDTPRRFATLVGLPVVHASLKGIVPGARRLDDPTFVERPLIGTTQIIDAAGEVLRCIDDMDDDAVIVETIPLTARIEHPIPEEFWLPPLREEYLRAWETQNALGERIYREKRKTANYDSVSGNYDRSRSAGSKDSELLFDLLRPLSGASVLEFGCGTGNYLNEMHSKATSINGIDLSRNMLLRAKSKLPGINLIQSNAECLPFSNESFDAVYSIQVLHHINGKRKLMSEVYRTLKRGGRFVLQICTYEQLLTFSFYYYFDRARVIDSVRFPSIDDIYQALSSAGFNDISSHLCNIDDAIDDRPSAYLEKHNRDGCSTFAFLTEEEIDEGCNKIIQDIKSGKVVTVMAALQNESKKIGGNATFIKGTKP